jgi:hypothetical protein
MVGGAVPQMLQSLCFGLWGSITGGQKFRFVAEGPNRGLADLKELIEVPEAFRYFMEGRHTGKVVVDIES